MREPEWRYDQAMKGTKQFNYKHLFEDDKTEFVLEKVCQIDTATKYPFLSKSACGGLNSILRTGTKDSKRDEGTENIASSEEKSAD